MKLPSYMNLKLLIPSNSSPTYQLVLAQVHEQPFLPSTSLIEYDTNS